MVPLISKAKATPTVTAALNAVSAKLDTPTLVGLVAKVTAEKQDPATVASDLAEVGRARPMLRQMLPAHEHLLRM